MQIYQIQPYYARRLKFSHECRLEALLEKKPTLGDYLLAIRQGEELTQVEFSKQLGISKQNLCIYQS